MGNQERDLNKGETLLWEMTQDLVSDSVAWTRLGPCKRKESGRRRT